MSRIAPPSDRLATLDLLRLVAALAVVAFHFLFRGTAGVPMMDTAFPEAAGVAIHGYLGVHLFFLISGFVIAWSAEGRDWRSFAIARVVRLYPAFLVCMSLTFALLWLAADPRMPVSAVQYLANLLILAPAAGQPFVDGVYWSIVLEIDFYGWVALAVCAGVFERWKLPLVAGWLVLCAANEFWLGSGAARLLFITEYGAFFAAGVLMHHIWSRGASAEALMLLAAAFLISSNTLMVGQGWMQAHYGQALSMAELLAANTVIYALPVAAIFAGRLVAPSPLILALGGLTYPLYLLHQNIGYLAIDSLAPEIGRWPALAAVTAGMLLLSWAIWRFVERPLRAPLRNALSWAVDRGLTAALRPLSLPFAR